MVTQLFPGQALRLQFRGCDLGLAGSGGDPGFPRERGCWTSARSPTSLGLNRRSPKEGTAVGLRPCVSSAPFLPKPAAALGAASFFNPHKSGSGTGRGHPVVRKCRYGCVERSELIGQIRRPATPLRRGPAPTRSATYSLSQQGARPHPTWSRLGQRFPPSRGRDDCARPATPEPGDVQATLRDSAVCSGTRAACALRCL